MRQHLNSTTATYAVTDTHIIVLPGRRGQEQHASTGTRVLTTHLFLSVSGDNHRDAETGRASAIAALAQLLRGLPYILRQM
jgi:hypothetical protein